MSRTVKGGKGPGFEYWSKRPNSQSPPGRASKDITHRAERQANKREAQQAVKTVLKDDGEYEDLRIFGYEHLL